MLHSQIINSVASQVEAACLNENNPFGQDIWQNHVLEVVKYADVLAITLGADREICILAALLHDYAGIVNQKYYHQHHLYGMSAAQSILQKLSYPQDKIDAVKEAIRTHRGSQTLPPASLEAACVADADAMAHIHRYDTLIAYAKTKRKLNDTQSLQFVKDKITRSWVKMTDQAKAFCTAEFNQIIAHLTIAA